MRSWRSVAALCALTCIAGCGGSSGKSSGPGSGGSSGSSSGNQELIEQVLGSANTLCEQIRSCYPELQTEGDPTCTAPASGGRQVLFQDPPVGESAPFVDCYRNYSDQATLTSLMQCQLDAFDDQLACFASCPEFGEDCATAGNDAHALCRDTFQVDSAELNACVQASQ